MTIWLMPIPKFFQSFNFIVKDSSQLDEAIDILQNLMLQGIIKDNCVSFWNSYKIIAREGRYPWKVMQGKTPLSLKELKGFEPWLGSGEIYSASREQGLAERKLIEEALAGKVEKLTFVELESDRLSLENNFGAPSEDNIKSTYWRKKSKIPTQMDPDRDACGVLWLCPILPFDGKEVVEALQIIEQTVKYYDFEPNIAMKCATGRSIRMFVAIMYDRSVIGEDDKAIKCHDELLQLLLEKGHFPYRLGIQSMNLLPPAKDDYDKAIDTLKSTIDPNNILAPGRYDFRKNNINYPL